MKCVFEGSVTVIEIVVYSGYMYKDPLPLEGERP